MITRFSVQGPRTQFPLDMLRYDSCWPRAARDVQMIMLGRVKDAVNIAAVQVVFDHPVVTYTVKHPASSHHDATLVIRQACFSHLGRLKWDNVITDMKA